MKDQDRKFYRAQNVVEKLSQELKEFVPNPEVFEHDMDLREEKEKQRSRNKEKEIHAQIKVYLEKNSVGEEVMQAAEYVIARETKEKRQEQQLT